MIRPDTGSTLSFTCRSGKILVHSATTSLLEPISLQRLSYPSFDDELQVIGNWQAGFNARKLEAVNFNAIDEHSWAVW